MKNQTEQAQGAGNLPVTGAITKRSFDLTCETDKHLLCVKVTRKNANFKVVRKSDSRVVMTGDSSSWDLMDIGWHAQNLEGVISSMIATKNRAKSTKRPL